MMQHGYAGQSAVLRGTLACLVVSTWIHGTVDVMPVRSPMQLNCSSQLVSARSCVYQVQGYIQVNEASDV